MKNLRILFTLCLLFAFAISAVAQTNENSQKEESTFIMVEEMPRYKGGDNEMIKFISENIKYPDSSLINNISGSVWIQFIVNKTGALSDFVVLKTPAQDLGEESLRVLKMMPDWLPGKQNGEFVNVFIKLPIKFTLNDNNDNNDNKKDKKVKKK